MQSKVSVKICGITNTQDMDATIRYGTHYAGLMFFEKSPRFIDLNLARKLSLHAGNKIKKVAVTVNLNNQSLDEIVNKVPFGKTAFASYAIALLLLKEETKLDEDQMDELCEKFYRHIKENNILEPDMLTEANMVPNLQIGHTYRLKRQLLEQNDTTYLPKSEVKIVAEHSMVFGITAYVGFINNDRVLVTGDELY